MRDILLTISILGLIAGSAFGQAPQTDHFTETEAKSRFEASGYSNVHGLYQSSFGAWHARATKNGQSLNLGLDVQGHVGIE
jgi:hypothetical protein